jgi:curved DNA-binding protein CbpA
MPAGPDPYRTLGLPPGAPIDDVKRAYRRLAKANHPDTAGPAAIPRFLAIQQAYEALVGPRTNGRPDAAGGPPPPPWQADPERARRARDSWQSRAGRRPSPTGEPGGGTGEGAADAREAPGPRRRRAGGRSRSPGGAPRPPDRATPGSTSYDFAEHEPFDPEWSGASWYGPSSGTYWTINPKEYADPRKHGPEYQARARRRAANGEAPEPEPEPADPDGFAEAHDAPPDGSGSATNPTGARSSEGAQPGPRAERTDRDLPPARPRFTPPPVAPTTDAGGAAVPPASTIEDELLASVRSAGAARSRLALALVGWPPIGIGLAFLLGELTGCGRFAATCVDGFALGTWIGQLAIILVLLVVPGLAAVAAVGTMATLAAAVPIAVLLSAAGGSREPDSAGVVLGVTLGAAWAIGVAIAVVRRSRTVRT